MRICRVFYLLHGRDQGSVPGSQGETALCADAAFFFSLFLYYMEGTKAQYLAAKVSQLHANMPRSLFLYYMEAVVLSRIRIGSGLDGVPKSALGSRRAKMTHHKHRKNKKVNQFHLLKCHMFSF